MFRASRSTFPRSSFDEYIAVTFILHLCQSVWIWAKNMFFHYDQTGTEIGIRPRSGYTEKPNRLSFIRLLSAGLLLVIFSTCAANRTETAPLSFPADLDQPFLTQAHMLGEDVPSVKGFFKRLRQKITGANPGISFARPSAVAADDNGDVYVVDADAALIICYHYDQGELIEVESFGAGVLSAPLGIEIFQNIIYVSEAESGLIQRFDAKFNALSPLEIEGLQRPGQLKLNPRTEELFIVDPPAHQIVVINSEGQVKVRLNSTLVGRQVIKSPIALDFSNEGNIVVLDGLTRRVEIFSADYKYISGFGGYDRVPGSFSYPRGLTISSDGYVFISDAAFGNVQIFDPKGALLYFFGKTGKEAGEFLLPTALMFDGQDNLYVVDQYNNRVQVFQYYAQGN